MSKDFLKIILYILGFLVVCIIVVFLTLEIVGYKQTAEVPLLIGKRTDEARELLKESGLSLKIEGEDYNAEIPQGSVIRQDIEPGRRIEKGKGIKVFVSKGAEMFSMPSFEGQLLDEAKLTLINLGLELGKITHVHSDTVENGRIIAQRPLPGNVGGNKVNFLVSIGEYEVSYRCPSFVNLTIDNARELADAMSLRLIEQKEGGRVIFQRPEAGTIIKRGDSVEVTLGRGWGLIF